ncbi:MAG: hypothetical protein ABI251_07600 [Mycobacteriaceae bacterium]
MRAVAVAALGAVAAAELALLWGRWSWWSMVAMILAVIALLTCRLALFREVATVPTEPAPDESLQRWQRRTETLISWSEGSRADWDRHLRPMLARQLRTGFAAGSDAATGDMVFGPQLWAWVDPSTVASAAEAERPGPGREVLGAILDRLEAL